MEPLYQKVAVGKNQSIHVKDTFSTLFHFHSEFELIFFYEGQGKCIIGDKITFYKPGDLFLLGPDLPHCFTNDPSNHGIKSRSIVVQLDKSLFNQTIASHPELASIHTMMEMAKSGLLFHPATNENFFEKVYALKQSKGFTRWNQTLSILNILADDNTYEVLANPGYLPNINSNNYSRINKVYNHVEKHFNEKIILNEVSALLHMTPSAFCRYFKKITKRTFINYVNEYRIGYACKKLIENQHSISEICFNSGFDSIPNFNKQFKNHTGLSPSEYKNKYDSHQF